jgi:hypothetical protein
MSQKLRHDDVVRIAELDDMRKTQFFRAPDRPASLFVKLRRRTPAEVKKAQGRMRTARWRSDMDARKAPTVAQIGMALAAALATTQNIGQLTVEDMLLVQRALHRLKANGFDVAEARKTMCRLRKKLVDPVDRESEQAGSSAAPIWPSSWEELPLL